jgi:hypothetical protein
MRALCAAKMRIFDFREQKKSLDIFAKNGQHMTVTNRLSHSESEFVPSFVGVVGVEISFRTKVEIKFSSPAPTTQGYTNHGYVHFVPFARHSQIFSSPFGSAYGLPFVALRPSSHKLSQMVHAQ